MSPLCSSSVVFQFVQSDPQTALCMDSQRHDCSGCVSELTAPSCGRSANCISSAWPLLLQCDSRSLCCICDAGFSTELRPNTDGAQNRFLLIRDGWLEEGQWKTNHSLSRGVSLSTTVFIYSSIYLRSLLTGWSFITDKKKPKRPDVKSSGIAL